MVEATAPPRSVDQLVVVGASAGGIEALSVLVASLPTDLPAPVVVAQHLDPSRPSHLADILGRCSVLPVRLVDNREPLVPGTVYVVPANRHVEITDHTVRVRADAIRRPTPSVDLLLTTAAEVFGERLVAVILTGAGSDGAAGAHAVKDAGGTVVIQDPATAAFPSMPRALAAPLVDAVVPLEGIGPLLGALLAGSLAGSGAGDPDLPALLAWVRERRGIDFSAYKPPTIARRLRRRMATAGAATVAAYLAYLEVHPEEEERLVADFLIKVTRFFRDPVLFDRLREQVLPESVAAASAGGRELRLWSAGCATGEEAYSLALLVADLLATRSDPPAVRIFATDLDETALTFARRGVYPTPVLADVPPDLVARYFVALDGVYEARKVLRRMLVFGGHDLAQRPPFPHVDLVLCRNVLIYFTPELQQRALEIFAYSLRDGGYLALGKSETVLPLERVFADVNRRLRLYRREGPRTPLPAAVVRPAPVPRSRPSLELALQQAEGETRDAQAAGGRAEDLVRRLPVGVAVVDRDYDIETINGVAREMLGIHGLAIRQDLIHLAQRIPSTPLRTAIDAVARGEPARRLPDVVTAETATGERRHLALTCHPDRVGADGTVATVLVLVEDITAVVLADRAREEAEERAERLAEANRQLLTANRELTDAVDRLREQGEELRLAAVAAQVSTEEIETLNEELQSSNEELETLHEEAQATIEELSVANEELQARTTETEELAAAHAGEQARLAAVLASMAEAVVVVDGAGRAVRTNAAYDALVGALSDPFVPADERGAPLPCEATPQARAARGEAFRLDFTAAVADGTRRWFEATGRPLPDDEAGVGVVVIHDITDRSMRRLREEFVQSLSHDLKTPLTAARASLGWLDLADTESADEKRNLLTNARRNIERLGMLIEDLLANSQLRAGVLQLDRHSIDLRQVVGDAVVTVEPLLRQKGQLLELGLPTPLLMEGDARRLEQVLINLLVNAHRHTPDGTHISVTGSVEGADVRLTVSDDGPGIPPEELEAVFARFYRTSHVGGGSGLGLAIAQGLVELHGGRIWAESGPGGGAAFHVVLPRDADQDRHEAMRRTAE